ncbi:hypothetical protein AOQ84DRAFT_420125 [Glonium stellatum]|uniref:Uncharacterized protein n=1 Tax=Glonium stellatum TaxID=574774 RepID=A0A8E2F940_9PEZI|nr:hypothetical protein AOQ84DRAFT_420125 [Glonium stellatum]
MSATHDQFENVKIHTAKCDICDQRNKQLLRRCRDCGWGVCTPCYQQRNGNLVHRMNLGGSLKIPPGITLVPPAPMISQFQAAPQYGNVALSNLAAPNRSEAGSQPAETTATSAPDIILSVVPDPKLAVPKFSRKGKGKRRARTPSGSESNSNVSEPVQKKSLIKRAYAGKTRVRRMSSSSSENNNLQNAYTPKKTTSGRFAPTKSSSIPSPDAEMADDNDERELEAPRTQLAGPNSESRGRAISSRTGIVNMEGRGFGSSKGASMVRGNLGKEKSKPVTETSTLIAPSMRIPDLGHEDNNTEVVTSPPSNQNRGAYTNIHTVQPHSNMPNADRSVLPEYSYADTSPNTPAALPPGPTGAPLSGAPIFSSGSSRDELCAILGEIYSPGQSPLARGVAALGAGPTIQIPKRISNTALRRTALEFQASIQKAYERKIAIQLPANTDSSAPAQSSTCFSPVPGKLEVVCADAQAAIKDDFDNPFMPQLSPPIGVVYQPAKAFPTGVIKQSSRLQAPKDQPQRKRSSWLSIVLNDDNPGEQIDPGKVTVNTKTMGPNRTPQESHFSQQYDASSKESRPGLEGRGAAMDIEPTNTKNAAPLPLVATPTHSLTTHHPTPTVQTVIDETLDELQTPLEWLNEYQNAELERRIKNKARKLIREFRKENKERARNYRQVATPGGSPWYAGGHHIAHDEFTSTSEPLTNTPAHSQEGSRGQGSFATPTLQTRTPNPFVRRNSVGQAVGQSSPHSPRTKARAQVSAQNMTVESSADEVQRTIIGPKDMLPHSGDTTDEEDWRAMGAELFKRELAFGKMNHRLRDQAWQVDRQRKMDRLRICDKTIAEELQETELVEATLRPQAAAKLWTRASKVAPEDRRDGEQGGVPLNDGGFVGSELLPSHVVLNVEQEGEGSSGLPKRALKRRQVDTAKTEEELGSGPMSMDEQD